MTEMELLDLLDSIVKKGYRIKLKYYNNRSEATAYEVLIVKGCITQGASGENLESAIRNAIPRIELWEHNHNGNVPRSFKSRKTNPQPKEEESP